MYSSSSQSMQSRSCPGPLTSQVRRRADGSIAPGDSWLYFREIADIEKALSIPYEPFYPSLDEFNRAAGELVVHSGPELVSRQLQTHLYDGLE